ncbi:sugar MFS transporter [Thalassotalea crassostreae]|uniref:sugar MFS transporter n=1 Tax=Thalassotalea crassostreae TaxID=1763536 RepID=UPI000838114C|nr:sugar MFS transporter [Thalassotalea crassostreae]
MTNNNVEKNTNYQTPLIILTSLFFIWGFITSLNDILIPHLKGLFDLSYFQAMAVNLAFFGAYALMSYPAGSLVRAVGYQRGIVVGLTVAGIGCALFYPAASIQTYGLFLGALFVLASGITILQVSANPYVSRLGKVETASSRLTLTQAFNSLGTTVAPIFGAIFILSVGAEAVNDLSEKAAAVQGPYLFLAAVLFILALIFSVIKLPKIGDSDDSSHASFADLIKQKHLVLGVIAIFIYVGAEVSIGSFLVNFFADPSIAGLEESEAAHIVAYYWGGAMVGRFIGAGIMMRVAANKVLMFNSVAAVVLILITIFTSGYVAMYAILAVGLCNSIMFPTIFSLAINKLGILTGKGSGLLCVAIVGGAIIPLMQGALADAIGVQLAFILPAVCYLYLLYYGAKGYQVK